MVSEYKDKRETFSPYNVRLFVVSSIIKKCTVYNNFIVCFFIFFVGLLASKQFRLKKCDDVVTEGKYENVSSFLNLFFKLEIIDVEAASNETNLGFRLESNYGHKNSSSDENANLFSILQKARKLENEVIKSAETSNQEGAKGYNSDILKKEESLRQGKSDNNFGKIRFLSNFKVRSSRSPYNFTNNNYAIPNYDFSALIKSAKYCFIADFISTLALNIGNDLYHVSFDFLHNMYNKAVRFIQRKTYRTKAFTWATKLWPFVSRAMVRDSGLSIDQALHSSLQNMWIDVVMIKVYGISHNYSTEFIFFPCLYCPDSNPDKFFESCLELFINSLASKYTKYKSLSFAIKNLIASYQNQEYKQWLEEAGKLPLIFSK